MADAGRGARQFIEGPRDGGRDRNLLNDRQPPAEAGISYLWRSLPRRHQAGKWRRCTLRDTASAPGYLRVSVLNGCRMVLRSSARRDDRNAHIASELPWESAEATALVSEKYRQLLNGVRALPPRQREALVLRQREALVLRYYLELSEEETAQSMGVRRGTVKSATSRALAALGQRMQEYS
jgi:RNA polymerase sigma factor (sigma-70 family)